MGVATEVRPALQSNSKPSIFRQHRGDSSFLFMQYNQWSFWYYSLSLFRYVARASCINPSPRRLRQERHNSQEFTGICKHEEQSHSQRWASAAFTNMAFIGWSHCGGFSLQDLLHYGLMVFLQISLLIEYDEVKINLHVSMMLGYNGNQVSFLTRGIIVLSDSFLSRAGKKECEAWMHTR